MNKYINETLHTLGKTISELEVEADYSTQRIEVVIHHILECLSDVKEYVLKRGLKEH